MRLRGLGYAVVCALATVASLTGCGVAQVGQSIFTEQSITTQLTSMDEEIESVSPGVTAEFTNEITGSYTFVVDVQVTADVLTPTTTMSIVEPVLAAFSSSPLAEQQLSFTLTAADGGILAIGVFDIAHTALSAEVDYWFGLSAALGIPLSMDLEPRDGFDAPYYRAIASLSTQISLDTADWDAARAVPDQSLALRSWALPRIDAFGSLPPETATSLAISLPDQNDAGAEVINLAWDGTVGTLSLSLFSEALGNRRFVVHLEPCSVPIPLEPDVANELAAAELILPPGAGSGACPPP
ncbi:hypothetical protein [Salinibacterium sp.]|uniref:hypothetical protein n=1 Tax=Salinibacterium sp. TaxID=1915057 RepID=UPI00286BF5C7|nr:hypothetical protein [Salinibacterium sp.]